MEGSLGKEFEEIINNSNGPLTFTVESVRPEKSHFALQIKIKNITKAIKQPLIKKAYFVTKNRNQFDGKAVGLFENKSEFHSMGEILPGLSKMQEFHFEPNCDHFNRSDVVIIQFVDEGELIVVGNCIGRHFKIEKSLNHKISQTEDGKSGFLSGCFKFFIMFIVMVILMILLFSF
ncbi:MAG: hypothetical protein ACMVP2_18200 [Imperialibacter sp.]|uniref:hypothetical protein n=1 Tax=Imperialibacter sp. TaxID=2038411 RepID=UPI003A8C52C1